LHHDTKIQSESGSGNNVRFVFQAGQGQTPDYLESATVTGSGITTEGSIAYSDLAFVEIDLGSNTTDTKYVLVTASMNMRPVGTSTGNRRVNYDIYTDDANSGEISRIIIRNAETGVESWGIGSLVHIFDVSGSSGIKRFTLKHKNWNTASAGNNIESSANLTAVALSTELNHYTLSNSAKRLTTSDNATATYSAVLNLTSDDINLPIKGDIYVAASINVSANAVGAVAEYRLESSSDGGTVWAPLGKPVKRSMLTSFDDGIVSLVGLLQSQVAGNYQVRVAHKKVDVTSATITTLKSNLVTVALAHSNNGSFPAFYSEVGATGVDITGLSTPAEPVTSTSFTAAADISGTGSNLFVNSQYLVSASNLDNIDRMRAGNQLSVSGASSGTANEYLRYISDNASFGACGFIGLMEDLVSNGSYTIAMDHQITALSGTGGSGDETLTTSEVILTGFQTYNLYSSIWDGSESTVWNTADNWNPSGVPTSARNITIPNVTNDPVISSSTSADCYNLTVESGATLTVKSDAAGTGSLIVNGTATGDVTIERFLTKDVWHYISGQTNITGSFTDAMELSTPGSSSNQFYRWDESLVNGTTGFWVDILNGPTGNGTGNEMGTSFTACKGYAATYVNADKTLSLSGVPYVENKVITITNTPASTNPGANLVGNPFTSTIAANSDAQTMNNFIDQNASVLHLNAQAVYMWDEGIDDYKTISNSSDATYIAPGQGFMVIAKNASETLEFNVAQRKHGTATFYKNTDSENTSFDLTVVDSQNNINLTTISFKPEMTLGLDPSYDARKLKGNPNIALYTRLKEDNGIDFAIQALPDNDIENIVIPVGIDVAESTLCEFSINTETMEGYLIYLQDIKENSVTNLKEHTYTTLVSESGTGRFFLYFKVVNGIEENTQNQTEAIHFYTCDKRLYIIDKELQTGTLQLFNMLGQPVMEKQFSETINSFDLDLPAGNYIVRIIGEKKIISGKVYVE